MADDVFQDDKIFVGKSGKPEYLTLKLANRHGLVTGATGTGKTVTLQVLAEGFSRAGVPVFAADIKGDLSGIAAVGEPKDFLVKRARQLLGVPPFRVAQGFSEFVDRPVNLRRIAEFPPLHLLSLIHI